LANNCFWGKSVSAPGNLYCSDPTQFTNFGPQTPGFHFVDYDDIGAIENKLQSDPNCVAVMLEPI